MVARRRLRGMLEDGDPTRPPSGAHLPVMHCSEATIHRLRVLLCATALVSLADIGNAEEERPLAPGLQVCFRPARDGGESSPADCRTSRLVAAYTPEGHTPGLFRGPARFVHHWSGFLEIDLADEFTFSLEGRGRFELTLGGREVLRIEGDDLSEAQPAKIELEGGHVPLVATYQGPAKGDGFVRLYWSSFDWTREPVPPTVLYHDPTNEDLALGASLRRGRELIATRRCGRCHEPSWKPRRAMPELGMDAPSLQDIGGRYGLAWLARWVADPRSVRRNATMPALLDAGDGPSHEGIDLRAWQIAAYLDSLKPSSTRSATVSPLALAKSRKLGGALFADLGCIGCHSLSSLPNPKSEEDDDDRLSLDHVAEKWSAAALIEFLRDPDARYKWIRMPDFRLSRAEAVAVVAFVLSSSREPTAIEPPAGLEAATGAKLVADLGCANCHGLGDEISRRSAGSLVDLSSDRSRRGCLATDPAMRGKAPRLQLDDTERDALKVSLGVGAALFEEDNAVEFAARQMKALRCGACHARDNAAAIWSDHEDEVAHLIPDDGRKKDDPLGGVPGVEFSVVQNRPPLTWTGEKLRPEWTRKFLSGELGYHVRPWLKSRMPKFPIRAAGIAEGLALEHGHTPKAPPVPESDARKAAIGKKLVLRDGGFACMSCHAAGDSGADSVFEVPGVNFQYTVERLRREHFQRWMLNPGRVVRDSRMPQFADLEGKSPFTNYYDGDARRQFEAIWQWLLQGRAISPPQ